LSRIVLGSACSSPVYTVTHTSDSWQNKRKTCLLSRIVLGSACSSPVYTVTHTSDSCWWYNNNQPIAVENLRAFISSTMEFLVLVADCAATQVNWVKVHLFYCTDPTLQHISLLYYYHSLKFFLYTRVWCKDPKYCLKMLNAD